MPAPLPAFLTPRRSPGVPYAASVNPYRSCPHGCVYCFAREGGGAPGSRGDLRVPSLLGAELRAGHWDGRTLGISAVADPYPPEEADLGLTRKCIEVLSRHPVAVGVATKSPLVCRDAGLLSAIARRQGGCASISICTLDSGLAARLEPGAPPPSARLRAIGDLAAAGVPAGVRVAPVIAGLTDAELRPILQAAREAGAVFATWNLLRLPPGVDRGFADWLRREFPGQSGEILAQVRAVHRGGLDPGSHPRRLHGSGPRAAALACVFRETCRELRLGDEREYLGPAA